MENEYTPVHNEIAKRAELIWRERNFPGGCDLEIWLEAERQLATQAQVESNADSAAVAETRNAGAGESSENRITSETAAESTVEFHIAPAVSDAEAVKAALQTGGGGARQGAKRGKSKPKNATSRQGEADGI